MNAYDDNRDSANVLAVEASVIAQPLLEFVEIKGGFSGTASELLNELEARVGDRVRRISGWPKNARSMSGHLKRLAPNLRKIGWSADQDRKSKKRLWHISRIGMASPPPTQPPISPAPRGQVDAPLDAKIFSDDDHDANDANSGEPWNPDRY